MFESLVTCKLHHAENSGTPATILLKDSKPIVGGAPQLGPGPYLGGVNPYAIQTPSIAPDYKSGGVIVAGATMMPVVVAVSAETAPAQLQEPLLRSNFTRNVRPMTSVARGSE